MISTPFLVATHDVNARWIASAVAPIAEVCKDNDYLCLRHYKAQI